MQNFCIDYHFGDKSFADQGTFSDYHSQRSGFTIAGGSANYEIDEKGHCTCGIFEVHAPDSNKLHPNVGSPTHSRRLR